MQTPYPYFGETMALLAAFIFSWTSLFFTSAGQRLGTILVNLLRLPLGMTCLALSHLVLTGRLWPDNLALADQVWIGLSGIVGLAIGDSALFKSFTLVGPRRAMTLMALAPVFTVVVAWSLLGEHLNTWAVLGILVVIGGVMLATLGQDKGTGRFDGLPPKVLRTGLLLALIASAGQGLGSVFAKVGMTGSTAGSEGVDALSATLVRITWATVAYWVFVVPRQHLPTLFSKLKDRKGTLAMLVAILLGPFISVWISLVAIKHTEAGIAQVLLGFVPIFVVVPAWLVYKDRPSPLRLLGIAVAVGGGALLFLR